MDLAALGWDESFARSLAEHGTDSLRPARVIEQRNQFYVVCDGDGEHLAEASGKLRHTVAGRASLPVVGDWVGILPPLPGGRTAIRAVLDRRSAFSRKVAGARSDEQVLAANIDTVFLVTSMDRDFNPRRLDRYLAAAWESGASPVIVLTKADIPSDPSSFIRRAEASAAGVPVHATSTVTGVGLDQLDQYLRPGKTIALLGSSGVGKSSLINALLGRQAQRVHAVRESDQRGRHTTVHRQLLMLPSGAMVVDTPGMRELHLWDAEAGIATAFDDIEALAETCRFNDCGHEGEPGCAVLRAVEEGSVSPMRLEGYHKLQAELEHDARRADPLAQRDRKRAAKSMARQIKWLYQQPGKRQPEA